MLPQSLLCRNECVPHYINFTTRDRVLRVYRQLHRDLNLLVDPLAKHELHRLAQHSFAAYKYVTDLDKINALLDYALEHDVSTARGAAAGRPKHLRKALSLAFGNHQLKRSPLRRLLARVPMVTATSSLAYALSNVSMPSCRRFDDHERLLKQSRRKEQLDASLGKRDITFWRFVHTLTANNVKVGANGRKLLFHPEDIATSVRTMFGQPLPQRRQANILKRLYDQLLRDAPRPVHPDVLTHIATQLTRQDLPRVHMRRLKELAGELYTVTDSGKFERVANP